uniref:transposase n=1 Tax=Chachezhania sediminis TaxID=2599291 RepID=UPI001E5EF4CA
MMGRQEAPAQLFHDFDPERHVPANHMLREIDLLLDGDNLRDALRPFYSHLGRPSIDPELIIRMLVIGYVMGIRSERRLCDEVHLNLVYRWFCRLGLEGKVPDHSTFSRYRHGKFRESHLLRQVFEANARRLRRDLDARGMLLRRETEELVMNKHYLEMPLEDLCAKILFELAASQGDLSCRCAGCGSLCDACEGFSGGAADLSGSDSGSFGF